MTHQTKSGDTANCQLPQVMKFSPFQATMTKIITHLDTKTGKLDWKLDVKIGP
jgi:hypothetical protein